MREEMAPGAAWGSARRVFALGKFYVRGQIVAGRMNLHGFAPDLDEAVLEATEVHFASWFGGEKQAQNACRGLRSITERPDLYRYLHPDSARMNLAARWKALTST